METRIWRVSMLTKLCSLLRPSKEQNPLAAIRPATVLISTLCGFTALVSTTAFSADEPPNTIAARHSLNVPPGFRATLFADELPGARWMAFGPDKALYITLSRTGEVLRLEDTDGDGRADRRLVLLSGLDFPSGIGFHDGALWIVERTQVERVVQTSLDQPATGTVPIVTGLPKETQLSFFRHNSRTLVFDPDGEHFYLSLGSSCNVCVETDPRRATVMRFRVDGSEQAIFARGLRNAVAMAIEPTTGKLWTANNERNDLSRNTKINYPLPIEPIVHVLQEGTDYGWPQCFTTIGGEMLPNAEISSPPGFCQTKPRALVTDTAHSAPLGATFYTGTKFPQIYRGAFFVAYHGSLHREPPSGYGLVYVPVSNGVPTVAIPRAFMSGLVDGFEAWGRPVDVKMGPDEALYVSDDRNNAIYRVAYEPVPLASMATVPMPGKH